VPKTTYNKPALTYEQQLDDKLIPRGLVVRDRTAALRWLRRIGYYRLSGYLYPYRISPTHDNFKPGASFDDAVSMYKFDCHLRLLMLQAIDRIEVGIRASATYHLGHNLGPFGYTEQKNFKPYAVATSTAPAQGLDFPAFLRRVRDDERNSSEVFIDHYRANYSNSDLPIWMMTEIISFGTLCRLIENLVDKNLQRMVARDFGLSQSQLISWLRTLLYIRNVCAHHGRLWNRTISVKPELLPKWRLQGVTRDRIYVILLMTEKLISEIAPNAKWKARLVALIEANPQADRVAMQFPADWQTKAPWA
jgi:abortive infection bacteriophage resistance protein